MIDVRQPAPRAPRWYAVLAVLVGLSAWFYFAPGPSGSERPTVLSGPTMGTTYTVKVAKRFAPEETRQAAEAIRAALDDVNSKMSTYVPTSEVSRFATAPANAPFSISEDTAEVMRKAMGLSEASDGAFDVTVRPLVDAWGFGPDGRPERRPGAEETSALLARVGYRKLRLDVAKREVTKTADGVSVDLSAIAKGYAVDRVALALEALGHTDYLVEVGGEMRAGGERASGSPWRVGIERPTTGGGREVIRVIQLTGHGLATSGNYRNYYVEDGVRYAHTIDPKTGQPVRHRLQSVSVVHPEAAIADGWATALMVLGESKAIEVAKAKQLAAMFVISGPNGALDVEMTDAFRPFVVSEETK